MTLYNGPAIIYYWLFQGGASVVVYSNLFDRFLLSIDYLFILGYICGDLLGKSWPLGFPLVCFCLCHFNCLCSFSVWFFGQDVEFDCIGFWPLPFRSTFQLNLTAVRFFLNASCLSKRSLYSSRWAMIIDHTVCSSNLQATQVRETRESSVMCVSQEPRCPSYRWGKYLQDTIPWGFHLIFFIIICFLQSFLLFLFFFFFCTDCATAHNTRKKELQYGKIIRYIWCIQAVFSKHSPYWTHP